MTVIFLIQPKLLNVWAKPVPLLTLIKICTPYTHKRTLHAPGADPGFCERFLLGTDGMPHPVGGVVGVACRVTNGIR